MHIYVISYLEIFHPTGRITSQTTVICKTKLIKQCLELSRVIRSVLCSSILIILTSCIKPFPRYQRWEITTSTKCVQMGIDYYFGKSTT